MVNQLDIAVYLPDEEARKFILFQQYWDSFSIMLERGVFDTKNGGITLHFDHDGTLQAIQRADFLYSRKHEQKLDHK